MLKLLRCLGIVGALSYAFAESTTPLVRPSNDVLILRLTQNIVNIQDVKVMVPQTGEYAASETHTGRVVTITLSPEAIAAMRKRTELHGRSLLYIGSLTLAAASNANSNGKKGQPPEAPAAQLDTTYPIPDAFSFAPRQASGNLLILEVIYAPDPAQLDTVSAYSVKSGKSAYKVAKANFQPGSGGDPGRVYLQLDRNPGNGGTLAVSFTPQGSKPIEAASLSETAAPKATTSDPTGGADVYVAANFTRSGTASPGQPANVYGVDTSLKRAFWLAALSGDNNFLFFDPTFTAKLYSKGQDSENTMTLSTPIGIQTITRALNPLIEQIIVSGAPKYETDEKQHNRNLVADIEVMPLFVDQPFIKRSTARFRFKPFAGAELGHTFHNDLSRLEGTSVARFKTGATAELKFLVNRPMLNAITLTASYTYRYLFDPEVFMTTQNVQIPAGTLTTSTGKAINVSGGTLAEQIFITSNAAPRRYLDILLQCALNANLAAQVEYSRGELPPAFQRVDKLQTGIAFLFNFPGK